MKTLIINTYAGSLLLGANAIKGSRIAGSYEDCGFGASITKANRDRFDQAEPDFHFINQYKQWPDQDLTEHVILAHPPCAAFSQQNSSPTKRGVNTEAFECTRKVLKYGMTNNVAAMAIESVMGALGGAWDVYDHMADAGGYYVYRILKNSICFGVPQYRERFWAVLVRKGLANPDMQWILSPRFVNAQAVLEPTLDGTPIPELYKTVDKMVGRLVKEHNLDADEVRAVSFPPNYNSYKRTGMSRLVQAKWFPDMSHQAVCRKYISAFSSGQPSVLAPWGYTPVLLGSSVWMYRGKPVTEEGYKAVMGFPTDYVFPGDGHYGMRTMLSKGVCPPVATWILDNVLRHLDAPHETSEFCRADAGWVKTVMPGRVVSFRPSRNTLLERYEEMMMLGSPESDELFDLRGEEADIEGRHVDDEEEGE